MRLGQHIKVRGQTGWKGQMRGDCPSEECARQSDVGYVRVRITCISLSLVLLRLVFAKLGVLFFPFFSRIIHHVATCNCNKERARESTTQHRHDWPISSSIHIQQLLLHPSTFVLLWMDQSRLSKNCVGIKAGLIENSELDPSDMNNTKDVEGRTGLWERSLQSYQNEPR